MGEEVPVRAQPDTGTLSYINNYHQKEAVTLEEPLAQIHLQDSNLLHPDGKDKIIPFRRESIHTYNFAYNLSTVAERLMDLADAGGTQDRCPNWPDPNQRALMRDAANCMITNQAIGTHLETTTILPTHQPLDGSNDDIVIGSESCNQSRSKQASNRKSEHHDSHAPMCSVDTAKPSHPSLEASNDCQATAKKIT